MEGSGYLDIGYHYIATYANGIPIDGDSDGVPDYLEDTNGNGLVDSGESDWASPIDLGVHVMITRPSGSSTLP